MVLTDKESKSLAEMLESNIAYQTNWLPLVRWAADNDASLEELDIPEEYKQKAIADYEAQKTGAIENIKREGSEIISGISEFGKTAGKSLLNELVAGLTAGTTQPVFADTPNVADLTSETLKSGISGTIEGIGGIMQDPISEFSSKPISSVLSLLPPAAVFAGTGSKLRKAIDSQKTMDDALKQLAKETAEKEKQLALKEATKKNIAELEKRKTFEQQEQLRKLKEKYPGVISEGEEAGDIIDLEPPLRPASEITEGAKTANPLIGLDEPVELTPASAAAKRLKEQLDTSALTENVGTPLQQNAPTAPNREELSRALEVGLARIREQQMAAMPAQFRDIPFDIWKQAKSEVDNLIKSMPPEQKAKLTESNINNKVATKIREIMGEKSTAAAASNIATPPTDYLSQFRELSEGDITKNVIKEIDDQIKKRGTPITSDERLDRINKRVEDIVNALKEETAVIEQVTKKMPETDAEWTSLKSSKRSEMNAAKKSGDKETYDILRKEYEDILDARKEWLNKQTSWKEAGFSEEGIDPNAHMQESEIGIKPLTNTEALELVALERALQNRNKLRGMVVLPGGGKKPKKLPPAQGLTTSAMVPTPSKTELAAATKEPGIISRLGKTKRELLGDLNLDEFRAERELLDDDLEWAYKQLEIAKTSAEIKTAKKAVQKAEDKLRDFKKDYLDIADMTKLVDSIQKRYNSLLKRDLNPNLDAAEKRALDIDWEGFYHDKDNAAIAIKDTFEKYPELYNELPEEHKLIKAVQEWEEPERAWTEPRGVLRRFEEAIGVKKK